MTRILTIGYAPEVVDFTDPAIPHDMNAEKIAAGLEEDMVRLLAHGWQAEHLPIFPDGKTRQRILEKLKNQKYDCIVLGAGVRLTTRHVAELEAAVNAIFEGAPNTPLGFNEGPDTSSDAVKRMLKL